MIQELKYFRSKDKNLLRKTLEFDGKYFVVEYEGKIGSWLFKQVAERVGLSEEQVKEKIRPCFKLLGRTSYIRGEQKSFFDGWEEHFFGINVNTESEKIVVLRVSK